MNLPALDIHNSCMQLNPTWHVDYQLHRYLVDFLNCHPDHPRGMNYPLLQHCEEVDEYHPNSEQSNEVQTTVRRTRLGNST